jgi:hypothetical protein
MVLLRMSLDLTLLFLMVRELTAPVPMSSLKTDLVPGKAPASPPATSTVVMMTAVIAIASRDPVIARNSLIGNPFVGDDTSHSPLKGPPETVTNPGYHPPRPQTPAQNIAEGTKHVRFAEHTPQPTPTEPVAGRPPWRYIAGVAPGARCECRAS